MITVMEALDATDQIIHESTQPGADAEALQDSENRLWGRVMEAIAAGAPQPDVLAAVALRTRRAQFARY